MTAPALYDVTVRHVRSAPVGHEVTARTFLWLVDLDELPSLPRLLGPLARFRPADHLGDPRRSLRQNMERLLDEHDIQLDGGQILMLASARVLGHVFNPLSLFWCHRADGSLACVVAEVHNTYGGRHAYVLHPDEQRQASTSKEFYVSPFFPVDGRYRMSVPQPARDVNVVITLHRPSSPPFVASMRGQRRPATLLNLLRLNLRHPLVTRLTLLRIHLHGVALWLRRVPIAERPPNACSHTTSSVDRALTSAMPRRSEEPS